MAARRDTEPLSGRGPATSSIQPDGPRPRAATVRCLLQTETWHAGAAGPYAPPFGRSTISADIYVDDAISGAEVDRRPALMRLLNALPPFTAGFMWDADRLRREQFQTTAILRDLSLAGVRVFESKEGGREIKLDSTTDKFMISVANFASELERVKAS